MSAFDNATLMITGGTGSFGSTVLKHFLDSDLKEIRIFSRDEKKQDDMRHELQAKHPENAKKVKFYIGDVRNPQSIRDAMPGVDYIFHAAALKQVPSCEFFPMQAVQTNIIGTDNVLHAAIDAGVKRVVCLSTDKAAYPINAMGMSDGVALVLPEGDLRVHADKMDVASVILTGAGRVEQLVILLHQRNAPLGVLPDPVSESVLDDLLFLLCQHGFPLVQHTLGFSLFLRRMVVFTVRSMFRSTSRLMSLTAAPRV